MKGEQNRDIVRTLIFALVFVALRFLLSEKPLKWSDVLGVIAAVAMFHGLQVLKRRRQQRNSGREGVVKGS